MNALRGFRALAIVTAVCAYGQIALGGVVRVSGSGLGCENQWPLCNGHPYPAWEIHSIIEYAHRTFGALTSTLMLATAVAAWIVFRRRRPLVAWLATAALAVVALEVPLGALVVFEDLAGVLVLAHLAVAMAILGLLVATAVLAFPAGTVQPSPGYRKLAVAMAAATYVLLLTGAGVVASNADEGCHTWPLCGNGFQLDFSGVQGFTMLHRLFAVAAGLLILHTLSLPIRRWRQVPGLVPAASLTLAAFLVQAFLIGVPAALTHDNALFNGLHVAVATAVWAGAATVLSVCFRAPLGELDRAAGERLHLEGSPAS